MIAGATQEVLTVCDPEKVLILSGKSLVPQLCSILEKHGRRKNQDSQKVARIPFSTRYLSVSRICKPLSQNYPGIQLNSWTTYLNIEDVREY